MSASFFHPLSAHASKYRKNSKNNKYLANERTYQVTKGNKGLEKPTNLAKIAKEARILSAMRILVKNNLKYTKNHKFSKGKVL